MVMFLLALVFGLVNAFLRGWVLTQLWSWFLVPLGLPSVSLAQAIGIGLTIQLIAGLADIPRTKAPEDLKTPGRIIAFHAMQGFAITAVALQVGWLLHQFA